MPLRSRAARPRKAYHHGDLRRALIAATIAIIEEKDVATVSLREAARRLRVTYAAPYFHFKDKAELLAAVAEEGYLKLIESVTSALADMPNASPQERLATNARAYLSFAADHAAHYRVMFLAEIGDRARFASMHETAGLALDGLMGLIGDARPDCSHAQRMELAVLLWSSWHGLASLFHQGVLGNRPSFPSFERLREAAAKLAIVTCLGFPPP